MAKSLLPVLKQQFSIWAKLWLVIHMMYLVTVVARDFNHTNLKPVLPNFYQKVHFQQGGEQLIRALYLCNTDPHPKAEKYLNSCSQELTVLWDCFENTERPPHPPTTRCSL